MLHTDVQREKEVFDQNCFKLGAITPNSGPFLTFPAFAWEMFPATARHLKANFSLTTHELRLIVVTGSHCGRMLLRAQSLQETTFKKSLRHNEDKLIVVAWSRCYNELNYKTLWRIFDADRRITSELYFRPLFLTQLLTAEMSNYSWARLSLFRFMLTLMRCINLLQACDSGSSSQLISAPRSWRRSFQRLINDKKQIIHLTLNEISTSQITIWPNTAACIWTCFRFAALQLVSAHCAHDRVSLLICDLCFSSRSLYAELACSPLQQEWPLQENQELRSFICANWSLVPCSRSNENKWVTWVSVIDDRDLACWSITSR